MISQISKFATPKLDRTQSSINFMGLKSQNSISPRKSQSNLKKQMSYHQLLMKKVTSEIEEEIEITFENAWRILQKDPQARTEKENNCVYEIISQLEIFKQYIEEGNKEIIKTISTKLTGLEFQKDQVTLSPDSDNNFLYIILDGEVSIYENNQQSNKEQMKAQFIRKQQKGQSINLYHIVFQKPFTHMGISDTNTFIIKLDKKIFRKYLQQVEEEKIDYEISFLQSIEIFSQIDQEDFQDILLNMSIQKLQQNQILYNAYSQPDAFYVIQSGQIGIFKENQVSKIQQSIKKVKFAEEREKNNYFNISEFQNQEDNKSYRNLQHQSTIFQIHNSHFYTSFQFSHTKIQELSTFDFFGFEEILSNKKRDHIAMSLQNNTRLYVFRSSFFIRQLLKFECFKKTVLQKRFTKKLEKNQQQNLSIQFEQNLKLGLKVLENQSPTKNSFIQDLTLNDFNLSNTKDFFKRDQKKSQSVNFIYKQSESVNPQSVTNSKKSILNRLENITNRKTPILNQYLNDSLEKETKNTLHTNEFITRQQEKIDSYIQRQNNNQKHILNTFYLPQLKTDQFKKNQSYTLNNSHNTQQENKQKIKKQKNFFKMEDSQSRLSQAKNQTYYEDYQFNELLDTPLKQTQSLKQISMNFLKSDQQLQSNNNHLQQKQKSEQSLQLDEYRNYKSTNAPSSTKSTKIQTNSKNIFSEPFLSLSQRQLQHSSYITPKKNGSLNNMQIMSYQNNPQQYQSSTKIQNFNILSLQKISQI